MKIKFDDLSPNKLNDENNGIIPKTGKKLSKNLSQGSLHSHKSKNDQKIISPNFQ